MKGENVMNGKRVLMSMVSRGVHDNTLTSRMQYTNGAWNDSHRR